MKRYPIFFGPFGWLVAGNGFIARVSIRGKCLIEETGDDFVSMLGVNPGAVAGDGANVGEAYHDFLASLRALVFAIAETSPDFAAFEEEIRAAVWETNQPHAELWTDAVAKIRSGEVDMEGVRRENAESDPVVEIDQVNPPDIRPELNEPEPQFEVAAA